MSTDEAKAFYYAVYSITRMIPYGKVTSYGHIALLMDRPRNSRQVGQALKSLKGAASENEFNGTTVPWWRVINSQGSIATRGNSNDELIQASRLQSENVLVVDNKRVDLFEYGWFPAEIDWDELTTS